MKLVQKFQTSDGALHDDLDKAKRHAEKRYGDALLSVVSKLMDMRNLSTPVELRSKMAEYIDANMDEFSKLQALKNDINKDIEPDEWDG